MSEPPTLLRAPVMVSIALSLSMGCQATPREIVNTALDTPLWKYGAWCGGILGVVLVVAFLDWRREKRNRREEEERERIQSAPVPPDPEWDAELKRMRDMPDPDA